eukprot:g17410.t1
MPLFERLSKGLALTPAGRGYHEHVSAAFEALRQATDTLKPEPGKVLISVTPTFAAKWLIPNLSDFSAQNPDVDLRILATEKVSSFHSDGIDLAIRQGTPPFGAALESVCLFRQEIVAVAAPSLVAAHELPLTPDGLAALPKLHDAHDLWPDFLQQLGQEDVGRPGLRLSQTALCVDAALAGQGIALVSRFLVARDMAAGGLVQVLPDVLVRAQDFYLLAERRTQRDPAVAAVIDWLTSRAEDSVPDAQSI